MAMETGFNLVGLDVAMTLHAEMDPTQLFVPYWSFDWYMEDSTDVSTGKRLFQTYIDAIQPYYEILYNFTQIDMGRVGLNL
jgi:hypothetical protein